MSLSNSPVTVSDLEQLRKIRRRSPHEDTEAFTVFLRSDVEAKLVSNLLYFTPRDPIKWSFKATFKHIFSLVSVYQMFFVCVRARVCVLERWMYGEATKLWLERGNSGKKWSENIKRVGFLKYILHLSLAFYGHINEKFVLQKSKFSDLD